MTLCDLILRTSTILYKLNVKWKKKGVEDGAHTPVTCVEATTLGAVFLRKGEPMDQSIGCVARMCISYTPMCTAYDWQHSALYYN